MNLTEKKRNPFMSANLEQHDGRLCVLRVEGELKKSELDAAQFEFAAKIAGAGTVKLLVLLEDFTGWERGEEWGDTEFFFSHRDEFEKIAVVGHPRWEAQVLAFTGAGLRKGPVKFFPETGEPEARAWLAG
jgi:SpoIIAA-like